MEEDGKTKEKTRVLAHSRRQKENDTFTDIAESLPIQENAKDLDKASILRVAIHYLKLRDVVQDGDQLEQAEHMLDENGEDTSTPSPPEERSPSITDFLPNYSRDVLQALDGFLLVVSRDGRVLFVSESITGYLGLRQVDVIGVHIQDIIHPQDCSEIANIFQTQGHDSEQVFDSKNPLRRNFVVRMRCAFTPSVRAITRCSNFKPIYCSCYLKFSKPVGGVSSGGHFLGLVALCRMASTPRIKEMCVGTSFKTKHNLDLSYAAVDTRIRWILGYDPSELMGLKAYQYFHPQDLNATSSCHMNLLSRGRSHSPCYRFMSRWGDWVWVRSDSHMLFNPASHLPDGIVIYTWIVRIDEEDDRMKAIDDGGDGEQERRQYNNFENSVVSEGGLLDITKLADPGIKPDPLTPPSVPSPVKAVERDSTPTASPPSQPSPASLQPLTLPPLHSRTTPSPPSSSSSSAALYANGASPQANSSVFASPDSLAGDFPPNVNPFPLKQARQSCAIPRSTVDILSPPDHQSAVQQGVAEVIDQSAFSDAHQLHQSFMSPPYTPYSQAHGKHGSFEAPPLSSETTTSSYSTYPTPTYNQTTSPPDPAHRLSASPLEQSPDGCRYGSVSPPLSVSLNTFNTSPPCSLQENLQFTSQATEFLVEQELHAFSSTAGRSTTYQDPNMSLEPGFLTTGMGQQQQQQQQQQTGNRPTVLEGSYVNQARMQYAGTAPGAQGKGRRKANRETTEISQWSQWLKGSAPAPVY